jgi:WhiB family redox-sensing transcriptional regulator
MSARALRRRDWRADAVCGQPHVDAELFFPVARVGPAYEAQVAAAKAVCARCPVTAECLADALVGIPDGIAGGLTEQERRALLAAGRPVVVWLPDAVEVEAGGWAA